MNRDIIILNNKLKYYELNLLIIKKNLKFDLNEI